MADGLQVFNTVLNLMDFMQRNQAAKDAARQRQQNQQLFDEFTQSRELQEGWNPGKGPDDKPLWQPPADMGEATIPSGIQGLIPGAAAQGQKTAQTVAPAPLTPALTMAPLGGQPKSEDDSDITTQPAEQPTPDTGAYVDPTDPSTGTYGNGAMARGWLNAPDFPYVNPSTVQFKPDENGYPVPTIVPRTKDDYERIGTQFMGYWMAHGGGYAEGARRARAAGMIIPDNVLEGFGRETFEQRAAQLRSEYMLKHPDADPGLVLQSSVRAVSDALGGYVPEKYMPLFMAPSDVTKAAQTRAATIAIEDEMKDALGRTARVEALGRTVGGIEGTAEKRDMQAQNVAASTAAETRAREANTPIGLETAQAYGNLDPTMPKGELHKYLRDHPNRIITSPKEKEFLQNVQTARIAIANIATMAEALATSPGSGVPKRFWETAKLMGEKWTGTGRDAAIETYNRVLNSFTTQAARAVNTESGVLTNQDFEHGKFFDPISPLSPTMNKDVVRSIRNALDETLSARVFAFYTTRGIDNPGKLTMDTDNALRLYQLYKEDRERVLRGEQPVNMSAIYGDSAPTESPQFGSGGMPPDDNPTDTEPLIAFNNEDWPQILSLMPPQLQQQLTDNVLSVPDSAINPYIQQYYAIRGINPPNAQNSAAMATDTGDAQ